MLAGKESRADNTYCSCLDAREKRWLIGIITLTLLTTSLPYIWVTQITPQGMSYSGLLVSPDDQNAHLSWARQAMQGHFFLRDLFTTESLVKGEEPLFTNIFCWVMGRLSVVTHIPLIGVYHGLRLLCAAGTLWLFYELCAVLTTDKLVRRTALLLVAFSMGGGWLQALFPQGLSSPLLLTALLT